MSDEISHQQAMILFHRAYKHQIKGELGDAIVLYKRSLAVQPTAEALTFLGSVYGLLERYDEAIAYCQKAIDLDPAYGNSYNDIGAYHIEIGRWEDSIPWLEKATKSERYEKREEAYLNLGRVYQHLGRYRTALANFDQVLEIDPLNIAGAWAKYQLQAKLN